MKCGDQVMSLPDNQEVVESFFNGCLSVFHTASQAPANWETSFSDFVRRKLP